MPVKGIAKVRRNYHGKVKQIAEGQTERAVYAILSQGAAFAQLMTPVDTSNLINSQYQPQIDVSLGKTTGYVGYTAEYAPFVHAASGKLSGLPRANGNGNYWDPAGEPEFLEKGFQEVRPNISGILRTNYRVG